MYSIVMVAAMVAAPDTPDFFKKKGGCHGCSGGCYGGCSGCVGGGAGCFGGGCHGGWGGGCHGGWGGGCRGGWGGSCHGCVGYMAAGSCCGGCQGGLSLGGCISSYGPPGTGCFGQHFSPFYSQSGYGYAEGSVPYFSVTGSAVVLDVPVAVSTLPTDKAQVVVRVPADAKLFADGTATSLTGTERVFLTPALETGKDFQYSLKADYTANGEAKSVNKQVVVRAGHRTIVDFVAAPPGKASSPVTVTMPENAKLFVDGVSTAATGGKHTFRTPELTKGQPYVYEFRAEVDRDGKTETLTQKVSFRAGEPVTVNFTEADVTRTALK